MMFNLFYRRYKQSITILIISTLTQVLERSCLTGFITIKQNYMVRVHLMTTIHSLRSCDLMMWETYIIQIEHVFNDVFSVVQNPHT